ncbi:hypothetical protein HELRODRAFT_172729 [Helobdella robusta]|uniref:Uncharacterized protein n=1 Tax=Helobdella robusta TaxID=6412 RepID=T1F5V4_HELRO|nr:hypothetical protein HELRODRAFT_172729 [Helobdella robusta]ESO04364.1 hypothetical protein HELRODRAFT_172729 [Helobdella robusta]
MFDAGANPPLVTNFLHQSFLFPVARKDVYNLKQKTRLTRTPEEELMGALGLPGVTSEILVDENGSWLGLYHLKVEFGLRVNFYFHLNVEFTVRFSRFAPSKRRIRQLVIRTPYSISTSNLMGGFLTIYNFKRRIHPPVIRTPYLNVYLNAL